MKRSLGMTGNVWDEGHGAGVGTRAFGLLGNGEKEFQGWMEVEFVPGSEWRGRMNRASPMGLGFPFKKGWDVPGCGGILDSLTPSASGVAPGGIFSSQLSHLSDSHKDQLFLSPILEAKAGCPSCASGSHLDMGKAEKTWNSGTSRGMGMSGGIVPHP